MKWVFWSYWVLYTLVYVLGLLLALLSGGLTGLSVSEIFGALAGLLPSVLIFCCLRGKEVHFLFFGVGFVAIAPALLQAHYFSSMDHVTVSMYVFLGPAALFMLGRMLGFFRPKDITSHSSTLRP